MELITNLNKKKLHEVCYMDRFTLKIYSRKSSLRGSEKHSERLTMFAILHRRIISVSMDLIAHINGEMTHRESW
jgi:hypothetical protein